MYHDRSCLNYNSLLINHISISASLAFDWMTISYHIIYLDHNLQDYLQ